MARELVLEVIARKNSRDLNTLADDFDKLARKTDSAGKSLSKTTTFSQHLDNEIAKTKNVVRELGQEFDRTGSKDVFAKLRGAQANLRSLEGIKATLSKSLKDAEDEGKKGGQRLGNSVNDGLMSSLANPQGMGLAGAIAAGLIVSPYGLAAMSAAGTMLGGVLMGAAGAGGVALGIKEAAKAPQIQGALKALTNEISASFAGVGQAFQFPLLVALARLRNAVHAEAPGIAQAFSSLAPAILPLEQGLERLIHNALPGFNKFLTATRPLLEALAARLPAIGKDLGKMFDAMASQSGSAKAGLIGLLNGVEFAIVATAGAVRFFGTTFRVVGSGIINTIDDIATLMQGLARVVPGAGKLVQKMDEFKASTSKLRDGFNSLWQSTDDGQSSLDGLSGALTKTTQAANATDTALLRLNNSLTQDQAAIAYRAAIDDLTKSIKENGRNFDITTEKGRANKTALDGLIREMLNMRDAAIAAAGGQNASAAAVNAANAKFNAQAAALRAQLHALGLSDAAINRLLRDLGKLPTSKTVAVRVNVVYRTIGGNAVVQAGRVTLSAKARGGYRKAAMGLVVPPSDPGTILMGEPQTGGEALIPFRGITRQAATGLINTVGAGYGLRATSSSGWRATSVARPGYTTITAGDALMRAFVTLIQTYVQGAGGDGRTLGIVTVRG